MNEHAVVIGASMAGLLAARALSDTYERVTLIERDELPAGAEQRRAIPQGRHVHALLPRGQQELEMLLPGITAELIDAGAVTYEALSEMYFSVHGHEMARVAMNRDTILASRPLIEAHVRRRVRALPGVEIRDRCDVAGLVAAPGRITGVRVLPRADGSAEEVLAADLVVAAGGRAGRLLAWLEGLGYPRPQEDRVAIDLLYASRPIRIAPGAPRTRQARAHRRAAGAAAPARARGPGARPLAAHARRLLRQPSADRPGGLRRLRGERRPAGHRGRHPRRRAAGRHRHPRASRPTSGAATSACASSPTA